MEGWHSRSASGLAFALGAHAIWGSMPIYLILVREVPVLEYVAWRTLFTVPLAFGILALRGGMSELRTILDSRRTVLTLLASASLIGVNWFLYVWAIQSGNVYAASLGYYILPLTMMLLGLVVLGETLNRLQWCAVALAALGVGALATGALTTLWLSVTLACTFGVYGLLRKTVAAGPLAGLALEAAILAPVALGVLGWFAATDGLAMGRDWGESLAIVAGGPMTAAPLLMFATAARRMPYTVIGFLQFTSPTIVFLLGLLVFGEELNASQLACFVAIWAAAALFTWQLAMTARRSRAAAKA